MLNLYLENIQCVLEKCSWRIRHVEQNRKETKKNEITMETRKFNKRPQK